MITMLLFGVGAAAAVRLRAKNRKVGKVKCMVGKQGLIVLIVGGLL
jgi:hypothetical protein